VLHELSNRSPELAGHTVEDSVKDSKGKVIIEAGMVVSPAMAEALARLAARKIRVIPFVSSEIEYMQADTEDKYYIAQANSKLNASGELIDTKIEARFADQYLVIDRDHIDYMDVSPKQIFSVAASLIPFLEHDDANRALMGANMQRQVQCL